MTKTIKTIADLTPDSANVNKGTERGHYLIDYSITELGAGRSILADADGVVVAGNKTLEVAVDHQLPIRVIQTDGKELVVVQRTDLRLTGKGAERDRARKLAIADNRASEVGYSASIETLLEHAQSGVDLSAMYRQDELDGLVASLTPDGVGGEPQDGAGADFTSQYGIIVMCENETEQERVYNELSKSGYNCKVVTT